MLAHRATQPLTFSQFRGLSALGRLAEAMHGKVCRQIPGDHTECRSFWMCRTPQRNPQLTHRTILLSLYRSTSDSSYIRGCGGLGDQLADGVRWSNREPLTGFRFAIHNEVPSFEVRSKRNDTHWVGLQPAANFRPTIRHFRRKDDPHF